MKVSVRRRLPFTRLAKQKRQSNVIVATPMSPTSKQILKAQQHLAQDHAFRELLLLRQANGEKKVHGDIKAILEKYNARGHLSSDIIWSIEWTYV
jgi:hypothetical protein